MRKLVWLTAVAAVLALPAAGVRAEESGDGHRVLARVNGEILDAGSLEAELEHAAQAGVSVAGDPAALLERMVQNRLLEQEGYRMGADEYPEVRNQVREILRIRGMSALLDSVAASVEPISEEELAERLDHQTRIRRYAHILVASEGEARALSDSLDQGTPFGPLAHRHSTDPGAGRGGDLGWAPEGSYVPEFEAAGEDLAVGEVSPPVRTEHGWHLITLLDERVETPGQSPAMRQALVGELQKQKRTAGVRAFVQGLRDKYDVQIRRAYVDSLPFGSEDPEVIADLRNSSEVIVRSRVGELTVAGLYRQILFKYFHGLAGREDARRIRDTMLEEWIDETLISYEAFASGAASRPDVRRHAKELERQLVRDEVIKAVAKAKGKVDEDEVEAFYRDHPELFRRAGRVKLAMVALENEAAAQRLRTHLAEGADLQWLAERSPGVVDEASRRWSGWQSPSGLGLDPAALERGALVGPLFQEERWLVGEVLDTEEAEAIPLEECRETVRATASKEKVRRGILAALERLRAGSEVEILPGAADYVALWVEEFNRQAEEQAEETMPGMMGMGGAR